MANFQDFVKESEKEAVKKDPYVLKFKDGKQAVIHYPDALAYMQLTETPNNEVRRILQILFGKNIRGYNMLIENLDGKPVELLATLVDDIWAFWDVDHNAIPGNSEG